MTKKEEYSKIIKEWFADPSEIETLADRLLSSSKLSDKEILDLWINHSFNSELLNNIGIMTIKEFKKAIKESNQ